MKRYAYFILFYITIFIPDINSQHIDAGPDIVLCQGETQATLNGNITQILTGRYRVESIPYNFDEDFSTAQDVMLQGTPLRIDDKYSDPITLPFPITFYGQTYDEIVVGSNGDIIFEPSVSAQYDSWSIDTTQLIPDHTLPYWDSSSNLSFAAIMGAYHDIDIGVTPLPSTTKLVYKTVGTAPNRKFIITYYDIPHFDCNNLLTSQQIVFNESDASIEVHIKNKPVCSTWNDGLATLGIQNEELLPDTCGNYPGDITSPTLPNRNTGSWEVLETNPEAYRFVPDANVQVNWYDQNHNVVANGATATVPAPAPGSTEIYTMEATYEDCHNNTYVEFDEVRVTSLNQVQLKEGFTNDVMLCANENKDLDGTVQNPQDYNNITYTWSDSQGNVIGNDAILNVNSADTYTLTVNVDGCDTSFDVTVTQYPYECRVPKGISPNGDNQNDYWDLTYLTQREGIDKVEIFNRWGKVVYDKDGYTNEFTGQTNNGKDLPAGNYYYVIKLLNGKKLTGWLSIIR